MAQTQPYYMVDGDRVELQPSQNYRAFRLDLPPDIQPSTVPERLGSSVNAAVSPALARHNIVVVPTGGPMSTEGLRSSLNRLGTITSEPPVYSVGGVDHVLINEFVVQFEEGISEDQANSTINEFGGTIRDASDAGRGRYYVEFPDTDEREALSRSNRLSQSSNVRYSEPNLIRLYPARPRGERRRGALDNPGCAPSDIRSDERFSCQWGLDNRGTPVGIADADINAIDAWSLLAKPPTLPPRNQAEPTIVAVVDEGVDIEHEDLREIIVTPYDAVEDDDDQQPLPADAHGTACAGIIGAVADNVTGVAGVAQGIKILPVRIATGNIFGRWDTDNRIIARGIEEAVDRGADILSNSWGGGAPANLINDAIDYGIGKGRVFVFAAGNDFSPVGYPAQLSTSRPIIAVSATNEWDEFKSPSSQDGEDWWGSNFGPEIVVAAPGVHIHTTDISGTAGYDSGNYTPTFNGTSSATPFVAGIAALILSRNPDLTPEQVREIISKNADDLGDPGFDEFFGHGRVNAAKALQAVN
ncbi:S8 family peptidase [Sinorhizobium meliloti]|uniref:S8 family peptidase n=1 Tax=Rhizobium meliloti TaxID=382 RepID=UPI00138AD293|nr:S8 family serine peptidase [Sinorhizobium meliloti]